MTISSEVRKAGPFSANGSNKNFAFTFKCFTDEDVRVVLTNSLGVESDLVLDSDYSVTLNPDQNVSAGGTVVTTIAYATGNKITLVGDVDYTQETDITNGGGFYPEVIESALDKLTMQIQQIREAVDRAVKTSISSTTNPDALLESISDSVAAAAASAGAASTSETNAATSASDASDSADAAAASAVSAANSAASINPDDYLQPADIGVIIGGLSTDETWSGSQRGAVTTDNDLSFDMNVGNNFSCTPTALGTLTFTNITQGQSGYIYLDNTGGYAISKAASVLATSTALTTISAAGKYILAYYAPNGTTVVITSSGVLA